MKKTPAIQQTVSPNLIPMIDIMFLLLLFFMLGADMGHRELEDVILPRADAATEPQPEDRLTINVHHRDVACPTLARRDTCRVDDHWRLAIKGRDCSNADALAAVLQTETAATRHVVPGGQSVSDRKVMIRADGAAPYALVQRAIRGCAEQGVYKVEVAAAKK